MLDEARLITADRSEDDRSPVRFRRVFTATAGPATLRITACGIYRAFLNGHPVGDHLLAPGWTTYPARHLVQEYDAADLLRDGDNVLGIEVAEGWYRGRLGFGDAPSDHYGTVMGPISELRLDDGDGVVVVTDDTWRWAPSATLSASLYDGEHYDQRLDDDWAEPGYDEGSWQPVTVTDFDRTPLVPETTPPVRRIETLAPVSIWTAPSGRTLVDFGQNMSGRLQVQVPAVADHTLTFRHAEVLEDDELGTRPLRNAAATDTIETSGRAITWEPAFTIHGFRYVEVDGWPGELTADDLVVGVCHTDMAEIGSFSCSHDGLNQLHENIRWSAKGNFVSIPTDCPQRDERLGWTGDLQVFSPTLAFLFDCRSMLEGWLLDLAAEQDAADGVVPMIVPALPKLIPPIPFAGWSDAAVVVPWVLYERFGDPAVLEAQWPSMVRWLDVVAERSGPDLIWRDFQLGDWLDPEAPPENAAKGRTDGALVANAYHVWMNQLMSRAAAALDRDDAVDHYAARCRDLAEAFRAEYVTPRGRLMSDSPTAYALALHVGLLTDQQRPAAARRLAELVEADEFRIGTGFLGTPLICDALVVAGAPDHAFRLLTQTTCPSWLYPVGMGATTIWERWDSMLPDGSINPGEMTSFNHYAFGAVGDFLHRRVAGLAPAEPGYRVISVRPLIGGGLTSAEARHRTPHGEAGVAWQRSGTDFRLQVTVPNGTEAVVGLPDGSADVTLEPGDHELTCTVRHPDDDPVNDTD